MISDWRWDVEEKDGDLTRFVDTGDTADELIYREECIHREILSLFLDSPSSPFSLHCLLEEEGERVGKWFTPSQAFHLIKFVSPSSSLHIK